MPAERESKSAEKTAARTTSLWPEQAPELLPIPLPDRLLVPIGIRGAGDASVKPAGTLIQRGDRIADHAAESSHVPLAPESGTLGQVRPIRLTSGQTAAAVELFVSNQPSAPSQNTLKPSEDFSSLVSGLERIRSAGVWADRHASPDLIGQLNQIVARPIDTLICTILDSDASLRLNAAIAARFGDEVVTGVSLLARTAGARKVVLVVESSASPEWMSPMAKAAEREKFQIIDLTNEYPQSDPTLIVYSLTRRKLRPGSLPTTRGVLVLDAAAALAVCRAASNEPMLTVPVAVHDHANRHSHFLLAPVGITIEHLLKHLAIPMQDAIVRGGDLLRDVTLRADAVIAGGELTIHVTARELKMIPEPCIRCAWCIEACPTLVHPAQILDALQRRDLKMADRAGVAACIECGICSYVCPSGLPLLHAVREIREVKLAIGSDTLAPKE